MLKTMYCSLRLSYCQRRDESSIFDGLHQNSDYVCLEWASYWTMFLWSKSGPSGMQRKYSCSCLLAPICRCCHISLVRFPSHQMSNSTIQCVLLGNWYEPRQWKTSKHTFGKIMQPPRNSSQWRSSEQYYCLHFRFLCDISFKYTSGLGYRVQNPALPAGRDLTVERICNLWLLTTSPLPFPHPSSWNRMKVV